MSRTAESSERSTDPHLWWVRTGLGVRDGRLLVAGRDAETLAREHETPLFAYDLRRIEEQARALQAALVRVDLRPRIRLALKAQREPEVLRFVRALGAAGSPESVGMDVCSPGEVLHALAHGWQPEEISYTGTNVSDRDLEVILDRGVHVNADLLTQIARIGRRAPGLRIGIRVNPRAGAAWSGYDDALYSGAAKVTKFGVFEEDLERAVEIAGTYRLEIDTVHFHVGRGFLSDGLPKFEVAVERAARMTRKLVDLGCPIGEVNVGGGLGVPQTSSDRPLDLDGFASVLARHLAPLDVIVGVEPGDFLVRESAALLAEVVTVEDRAGMRFVGLDAGFSVAPEHFIYGAPFEIVPCRAADGPRTRTVTISGNINEGDDLWAEGYPFPDVDEGDIVAILGIGSYGAAMAMTHCLRPLAKAVFFAERR